MALTLVSTTTVGSGGAASIEFTNIPQTGKDLLVLLSARTSGSGSLGGYLQVRFSGVTSSVYVSRTLQGDGSSASSANIGTQSWFFTNRAGATDTDDTTNTFGDSQLYIANYTSSANKSLSHDGVTENNGTNAFQELNAGAFNSSNAVTSILIQSGANFVQHSTASLYIIS